MSTIPDTPVLGFWSPANMQTYKTAIAELQLGNQYCQVSSAALLACATSTWTMATFSTQNHGATQLYAPTGNGVTVTVAGQYMVGISMTIAASATNRRIVGIGTTLSGSPQNGAQMVVGGVATGPNNICFSREMTFNAGDIVTIWTYQDSGAPLNLGARDLLVRALVMP
jgi:hypothetical protein